MQTMTRDSWTDERLDDLNDRVRVVDERVADGFHRMDEEFTAVRREISTQGKELRQEMAAQTRELREEMAGQTKELREEMKVMATGLNQRLDSLNQTIVYGGVAMFGIVVSALVGMAAFAG